MSAEVWVVADLGFGDSGKGTVTDFLVRDRGAHTVVRWHGGAQAGHRVVTEDGRAHVFSQLGAGSFVPGVHTHLGGAFVLHPLALAIEAQALQALGVPDALDRLTVDPGALVVTPFSQAANRLQEMARGAAAHGTCGVGFGETVRLALEAPDLRITARDLARPNTLWQRLRRVQEHVRSELCSVVGELRGREDAGPELALLEDEEAAARWMRAIEPLSRRVQLAGDDELRLGLRTPGAVILEGAQGALLDEWAGFHPHTTWSTCTTDGATALLTRLQFDGPVTRLGVLRTYATRHGAGPFPTELSTLSRLPEAANGGVGWQGAFRRGWLDLVLLRYALAVSPVDGLALTHLDRLDPSFCIATAYRAVAEVDPLLAHVDPADGRRILSLRPSARREDLHHQERLTELATRIVPELERVGRALPEIVEQSAGVPLSLTSSGPTAADKRWRGSRPSLLPPATMGGRRRLPSVLPPPRLRA